MTVSDELKTLAAILADWSSNAPTVTIYLFGSRVRGDHHPDSDVDISVHWHSATDKDVEWWTTNNEEDFASINARLPGILQILENTDPVTNTILVAAKEPIHVDRNVICVCMPRTQTAT